MIERYTLTSLEEVAGTFGVAVPAGATPRFNIAPLQIALIRDASAITSARWGLLPPWRGHGGKRDPHVRHARIETIDGVPLLRNAFKRQRCLVIADGFFVFGHGPGGNPSLPVWMHPAPDPARPHARSRVIAFAGLAATHRDDGQPSFAILVGFDGPVVIPASDYTAWLTGPQAHARALLASPPRDWRADPVSAWVRSIAHDDARCVQPVGNPAQGELF